MQCDRCKSKDLTIFLMKVDLVIYRCEDCGSFIKLYK